MVTARIATTEGDVQSGQPKARPVETGSGGGDNGGGGDAYDEAVLALGPVRYFKMDDAGTTIVDSSPSAIDATLKAGGVYTNQDQPVSKGASSSLRSTASNGAVDLVTPFSGGSNFTVCGWINLDDVNSTYDIVQVTSSGQYNLQLEKSAGSYIARLAGSAILHRFGSINIQANTSYFITLRADGDIYDCFLNETKLTPAFDKGSAINDGVYGFFGRADAAGQCRGYGNGFVVYDYSLSDSEIATLYNAGKPTQVDYSDYILVLNPVAYYRMNETEKPTLIDHSGYGLDGTYRATSLMWSPLTKSTGFSVYNNSPNTGADISGLVLPSSGYTVTMWLRHVGTNDAGMTISENTFNSFQTVRTSSVFKSGLRYQNIYDPDFTLTMEEDENAFVVWVYTGSQYEVYVNGVKNTHVSVHAPRDFTVNGFMHRASSTSSGFRGRYDESAFFDRVLTDQEIQKLYDVAFLLQAEELGTFSADFSEGFK